MSAPRVEQSADDPKAVLLWIKAVPGASRDQIAGVLGDRLKIRISAAPEAGKANQAICALLAKALGLKTRQVEIDSGHGNPEKIVRISGLTVQKLIEALEQLQ